VKLEEGDEGTASVMSTGVSVASGAVVVKSAGGKEDTEGPLGVLPEDPAPLVVIEPEWEDGSTTHQVTCFYSISIRFSEMPNTVDASVRSRVRQCIVLEHVSAH
jgi:hypothetical protein